MSKNYTHLSLGQRYQIEALLEAGIKQKHIALQLGVSESTISRELKRNVAKRGRSAGEYVAVNAQRKTDIRHQIKAKKVVFTEAVKLVVSELLQVPKWSPEIISAHGKINQQAMVSHERIYQWIWECKHTNKHKNAAWKNLHKSLRHHSRRRKRRNSKDNRGLIKNRVPIEKRPAIVKKRKRLGDVEVDLMMGKDHKGALLVMTDRASLHTMVKKLPGKGSLIVAQAIINKLAKSKHTLHTLTFDNDQAFSGHELIGNKVNADTYFTRPYTSQDKGTVENRIGVIRRFFPKKTDLRFVTNKEVKQVETFINNRPVRKFNYLTPNQVLQQKIALIT